jgi:hypothetical protein
MAGEPEVLAHWHLLLDDFATSSKDFYSSVGQSLASRQLPAAKTKRVDWSEGGLFSAKREYLRVTRDDLTFDICAAPYGNGFFFSSWLVTKQGFFARLATLPMVGPFVRWAFKRITYFAVDTRLMFQESVHRAVTDTIDGIRVAKGLRALSPDELRPVTNNLLA